jgi:DNA-binding XRE family transcriptional regulator
MEPTMKPEKRKRLEAAGWRVGTAGEFLGLTNEEAALIELKLDLARAVKAERIRRKMTQEELGERLGSSQSRVAKMEGGDPSVSIDLLIRALFRLGVSRRDLVRHLSVLTRKRAA